MNKEVFDLFTPYEREAEERIYYFCYSRESKYHIPGWSQEDLAQELLIKMHKAMTTYDISRSFVSYMNTVCKRRLIDLHRGTQSSKDAFYRCEVYSLSPSEDVDEEQSYYFGEGDIYEDRNDKRAVTDCERQTEEQV